METSVFDSESESTPSTQLQWYFGRQSRNDAEQFLKLPGNQQGSFMIRERSTEPGEYVLSMLDEQADLKHFKIIETTGREFYIAPCTRFPTIVHLVEYYRSNRLGNVGLLTKPCLRYTPLSRNMASGIRDKWEIRRDSLELTGKLGEGNFGEVWKGTWNNTREVMDVAIKTLKNGTMTPKAFLKEAAIMKRMVHNHLVQLFAVCSDREPILIVTELMRNGSLLDYLKEDAGQRLVNYDLTYMCIQIADGMFYMESKQFVHRDLAARNILVGEQNLVKIGDFGLARIIEGDVNYTAQPGHTFPIKWTAPEAATHGTYTTKSDVWSYGVVLYEVMTKGGIPYPGMSNSETLTYVSGGKRMRCPPGFPPTVYRKMLECWKDDPESRPTFKFLRNFFVDEFEASAFEML